MRMFFLSFLIMLIFEVSALADFQTGVKAYKSGDYATALHEFKPLAEQGNADAQSYLGSMYATGFGVPKNYTKSVKWYRMAANQGDADGQTNMGIMYKNGYGVPLDYKAAAKWYSLAAEQGNAGAQYFLSKMYEKGHGVPQDSEIAAKWRVLAEQSLKQENSDTFIPIEDVDPFSSQSPKEVTSEAAKIIPNKDYPQRELTDAQNISTPSIKLSSSPRASIPQDIQTGLIAYKRGDFDTAYKEFMPLAEQGDAVAQYYLGEIYSKVMQDASIAVRWYRKAAKQGHVKAQFLLGLMYRNGEGIRQNNTEAVNWLVKAAKQGHVKAQFILGLMYDRGKGVQQDDAKAVIWYRKAAEQGNAYTQWRLGEMYSAGEGVNQDFKEAFKWYQMSANQGDADAQFALGGMYREGQGVAQNYSLTAIWYHKAADQGEARAQSSLGDLYGMGQGVRQNYAKAYSWYSLAAAQGNATAIELRDSIIKIMSPDQISEGQKMASDWRPEQQAKKQATPVPLKPQPAITPLPQPATGATQNIAELQRQLKKIEGLIAKRPKPVVAPQPISIPKFPTKAVTVRFDKGKPRFDDVAVIISNADYKKGKDIPNVTPAYADAAGMKNYIQKSLGIQEENIIFLKDASQSQLIATFGSATNPKGQLFNYVKAGKSRVFVYYSGHGAPGGDDGSSYIVPTDAQASLIDLNGYPLSTLYKNLGKIPAKSVTVVLEACFSGASQSGSVIAKASPIYLKSKETTIPSNITVIAAGAANQIASWEQDSSSGLFTKYFLKGMSGEADAAPYGNGDGKVGYGELGAYFKETLTYYARRYYGREQTVQIVEGGL